MRDIRQKIREIVFQHSANSITAVGIILTVGLHSLLWSESDNYLLIFLLSVAIGLSDLDGILARRYHIVTSFGGFLDQFRDKFFACPVFVYFLKELWRLSDGIGIWLPFIKWLIVFILATELFVFFGGIAAFIKKIGIDIHWTGKVKTNFYFIAISWWFLLKWMGGALNRDFKDYLCGGLVFLLSVGVFFGILSVVAYTHQFYADQETN